MEIFKEKVLLAPLAGITNVVFRKICRRFGADMCYTEMVSAKALHYNDKKSASLLEHTDEPLPLAVQIFGSDPDIMAEQAHKLCGFADVIDINMGCPVPKIYNNGEGCALMNNPSLVGTIVKRVSEACSKPVTVKIRAGANEMNYLDIALIAQKNGAAAVTLHARTRAQMYSGTADWDMIKRLKAALDIPIIGNGDIFCADDAFRMWEHTQCDSVMIARGALGNPWIFRQIAGGVGPTDEERCQMAFFHLKELCALRGQESGVKEARKMLAWYFKGVPGGASLRKQFFQAKTISEVEEILWG